MTLRAFTRTWAMTRKEILHIARDPRSLALALALPFIMLLMFSYALSLDVDHVPTLVLDHDNSPESRDLISRFQGSPYFDVALATGYSEIERKINRSEILLAVVIPEDFSKRLLTGTPKAVQLILDGSDSNTASIAKAYAESVIAGFAAARFHAAPAVDARVRVWYNSSMRSRNFIVPGLLAVILMIIAALLTSLTIAREWEMGTMEQLLSTPLRPAEMIVGKLGAFFLLGVADAVISIVSAVFIFEIPFRGNIFFLAFATSLFLIGAFSWGLFVSSISSNQLEAFQVGILSSFLPAFLLSGFVYATENMPLPIQAVSRIVPSKYFVTILKSVFLKGMGFETLWREVLFLAVYAVAVGTLAAVKLKKKVA